VPFYSELKYSNDNLPVRIVAISSEFNISVHEFQRLGNGSASDMPVVGIHAPGKSLISAQYIEAALGQADDAQTSLLEAVVAAEQGREVFAIPGSIHSPLARGCHALIRQGAKLVETAPDILEELGALAGFVATLPDAKTAPTRTVLNRSQQELLELIGFDPVEMDTLIARSGLTPGRVSSMLLLMELHGLIEARPGGRYQRTS